MKLTQMYPKNRLVRVNGSTFIRGEQSETVTLERMPNIKLNTLQDRINYHYIDRAVEAYFNRRGE